MSRVILLTYFLLLASAISVFGHEKVDSLLDRLSIEKDTFKLIEHYFDLGSYYEYSKPDSGRYFYEKAFNLSKSIDDDSLVLVSMLYVGYTFESLGRTDTALSIYLKSLDEYGEGQHNTNLSSIYSALGNIYYYEGKFEEALKYYRLSLKIATELDNELWQSYAFHNIGLIYDDLKEDETAVNYYKKSLKIFIKYDDKNWMATCYNSLGSYYMGVDSIGKAKDSYQKSLEVYDAIGDVLGVSMLYDNLAHVCIKKQEYDTAVVYLNKALDLALEVGDHYSLASIYHGLSDVLFKQKKYKSAIDFCKKSLIFSKKSNMNATTLAAYQTLNKAYANLQTYKEAFMYADSVNILRKVIFDLEKTKTIQQLEGKYQFTEKQLKIENLEKDKVLKNKQNTFQKILLFIALVGILIVLVFLFFLYKALQQKKQANRRLKEQQVEIREQNEELNQLVEETMTQKEEIEKQGDTLLFQNEELKNSHQEINQSIAYAKRIQNSILPKSSELDKTVDSSFVIFKPKDKVSGDFYWWTQVENQTIITAVDCTGHGVPGAFMSMLGISFLREIVVREYITHPGVILRKLRKEVVNALKQKGLAGEQKDGMDMSLISIDNESLLMQYAGANNPIYIVRDQELELVHDSIKLFAEKTLNGKQSYLYVVKPDKMPIAIYDNMSRFTTHEIQLNKNDKVYLFSDGFADQFGGPKGKKFKYKPFKNLLLDNSNLPMQEQKAFLEEAFKGWIGEEEQIDDILVLGVKM